ncbi:MAG: class I SAM-dependent methyltransferase [Dehalococcoidia bacterium]|jgi:hypothetical protein
MKRIKACRVCQSPNITEILDLGKQPYANSLLKSLDEKEKLYPLSVSYCSNCSLVQLNETAEPTDLFSNYVWVTSTSKTALEHAKSFYNEVLTRMPNLKESYVLEVASNDGAFLKPFTENNYIVLGVDPAKNIADIAIANGIPTECKFFGVKAAGEIVEERGQARVVVARNVLPHVANLHDFVQGLQMCLDEDGILAIEFHYAKVIYEGLHYDSIYHEHLCYYTLKSVEKLLNQYDLFVVDIIKSPISGGSLILYIRKGKKGKESPVVQSYRDAEKAAKVNELNSWENFAKRVYSHRQQLMEILTEAMKKNGPIVGYGASARSSTLLNFCKIDTRVVSMIADQNELKQGKYTAGTHIPIADPVKVMKEKPGCVLILAWNFADEIIQILRDKYHYTGMAMLPLPNDPTVVNIGK